VQCCAYKKFVDVAFIQEIQEIRNWKNGMKVDNNLNHVISDFVFISHHNSWQPWSK